MRHIGLYIDIKGDTTACPRDRCLARNVQYTLPIDLSGCSGWNSEKDRICRTLAFHNRVN